MKNLNLIESFSEFKEFKSVDRATMQRVLEEVFRAMLRKRFGSDEYFSVVVNVDRGDVEIIRTREVVDDNSEDIWDPDKIPLSDAKKLEPELEVGDEYYDEIGLEDFGRRAVLSARQTLVQKIMELEKDNLYKKYKDRIGEIITGEVHQTWKKEILVLDDEGNELILPKTEQIPADFFKKGDTVKAIVQRVDTMNNNPKIIISRCAPEFLGKLLENEVPEIFDGLITIKKIVREPGERAKVAVESYDDRIDPVGACVGMKGSRIHGIVKELRGESIDVINYTSNLHLYITRSLSPAKIKTINLDQDNKKASVYLSPDQVSLAIGKGGHNIKLAARLTGYEIDVFRDIEDNGGDFDIDLDEFLDEIDEWIIDELKNIGLDTAKAVLDTDAAELVRRTELEEETVKEVIRILKSEFE